MTAINAPCTLAFNNLSDFLGLGQNRKQSRGYLVALPAMGIGPPIIPRIVIYARIRCPFRVGRRDNLFSYFFLFNLYIVFSVLCSCTPATARVHFIAMLRIGQSTTVARPTSKRPVALARVLLTVHARSGGLADHNRLSETPPTEHSARSGAS